MVLTSRPSLRAIFRAAQTQVWCMSPASSPPVCSSQRYFTTKSCCSQVLADLILSVLKLCAWFNCLACVSWPFIISYICKHVTDSQSASVIACVTVPCKADLLTILSLFSVRLFLVTPTAAFPVPTCQTSVGVRFCNYLKCEPCI